MQSISLAFTVGLAAWCGMVSSRGIPGQLVLDVGLNDVDRELLTLLKDSYRSKDSGNSYGGGSELKFNADKRNNNGFGKRTVANTDAVDDDDLLAAARILRQLNRKRNNNNGFGK